MLLLPDRTSFRLQDEHGSAAGSSLSTEITGWQWTYLTDSTAWNLELGSRLQWLGPSPHLIIFNDRSCQQSSLNTSRRLLMSMDVQEAFEANSVAAEQRYMRSIHAVGLHSKTDLASRKQSSAADEAPPGQLCSVVFDISSRQRLQILPRPVYSVSPDGRTALSFDFGRMDVAQAGDSTEALQLCPVCTPPVALALLLCLPKVHISWSRLWLSQPGTCRCNMHKLILATCKGPVKADARQITASGVVVSLCAVCLQGLAMVACTDWRPIQGATTSPKTMACG